MKHRSVPGVLFLSIITLGIYSIIWNVKTEQELNKNGGEVPTAWLMIIPLINFYWLWKYFEAAEKATSGRSSAIVNFIISISGLYFVVMMYLQHEYNRVGATTTATDFAPVSAEASPVIATETMPTPTEAPAIETTTPMPESTTLAPAEASPVIATETMPTPTEAPTPTTATVAISETAPAPAESTPMEPTPTAIPVSDSSVTTTPITAESPMVTGGVSTEPAAPQITPTPNNPQV